MNVNKKLSSAAKHNTASGVTDLGKIIIRDKDGHSCTLTAPTSGSGLTNVYRFDQSGSPCSNNTARNIQLSEFPSATVILLTSGEGVTEDDAQHFWFKFVTTRKRTSTIIIELEYIDTYAVGDIIEPGLRLIGKFRRDDNVPIRDELSGAAIRVATSPPAPPENL